MYYKALLRFPKYTLLELRIHALFEVACPKAPANIDETVDPPPVPVAMSPVERAALKRRQYEWVV
jgi:hypothetical protein